MAILCNLLASLNKITTRQVTVGLLAIANRHSFLLGELKPLASISVQLPEPNKLHNCKVCGMLVNGELNLVSQLTLL